MLSSQNLNLEIFIFHRSKTPFPNMFDFRSGKLSVVEGKYAMKPHRDAEGKRPSYYTHLLPPHQATVEYMYVMSATGIGEERLVRCVCASGLRT